MFLLEDVFYLVETLNMFYSIKKAYLYFRGYLSVEWVDLFSYLCQTVTENGSIAKQI